jgi:sterol-4alpha-carboxylate 3-dehydrogenase (decarboxylating)
MLTCAIRPAGIIGEKDVTFSYKFMEHAFRASRTVLRMQLGNNNNLFDVTYVGNISYAHMLAAQGLLATHERYESGQALPLDYECIDGEAFNITNDSPAYFWDIPRFCWALVDKAIEPHEVLALPESVLSPIGAILEGLFALVGKTPRLTRKSVRYSCMTRYMSCAKAKARLGYKPLVSIDEGLTRAVGYMLASGVFDDSKTKKE